MGTIAVWTFFIFWGGGLIQSLLHRNLTLAFTFALRCMLHGIYFGDVEFNWKTVLAAIFGCWLTKGDEISLSRQS
jgi:hypothetical protein